MPKPSSQSNSESAPESAFESTLQPNPELNELDSGIDLSDEGASPLPDDVRKKAFYKFLSYSFIGVLLFLVPIYWGDQWTIGIGVLAVILKGFIGDYLSGIAMTVVVFSAVMTVLFSVIKPAGLSLPPKIQAIFQVSWIWVLLRVLGALFIVMIYFGVGPEWISGDVTGGVILNDLNPTLMPFFFFAILLMAFLTDYGFMEYVGTMLSRIFHKVFKLPGRSAVDASASWLGAAPVGVLITSLQYDRGYYNEREAASIATSFSLASAAFCLVVAEVIGINHLFLQFYATVIVASVIAAIVMVRIPPLSLKSDRFLVGDGSIRNEEKDREMSLQQTAVRRAVRRAHRMPNFFQSMKDSLVSLADVYFGLLPVVFAVGTIALALSEYTPLFTWISAPLVPLLNLLQVPEAAAAAPALVVGFADMFLPAVVGKGIESEVTRFIIACMSVTQVIYMTEVGSLILKSNIKVNLFELMCIFLIRTLLTLPIVVAIAYWFVF